MKTLLSLLLSLLCASAYSQSVVVATVTVTNIAGATNGSTLVINGVSRLFTNNVTTPATQISTVSAGNIGATASNIFAAYAANGNPQITPIAVGTNVVQFRSFPGFNAVVTIGGTFGTVTFSTQSLAMATVVRVPSSVEGLIQQTNVSSGIVDWINNSAQTNYIAQAAKALFGFVNASNAQVVPGAKNFTGGLSGTGGVITNTSLLNPNMTNAANYGNPFRSPGAGSGSEQFGIGAASFSDFSLSFGDDTSVSSVAGIAFGENALVDTNSTGGIAIGYQAQIFTPSAHSIAIGYTATVNPTNAESIAIGYGATVNTTNDHSVVIGTQSQSTAPHQITLGTGAEYVNIPGGLQVVGSITNIHASGTNVIDGGLAFLRKNNTSLANGNNAAVSISTNLYVKVSGPTGAFAVCGIAGGSDGRYIILQNSTGQTMTLSNDSGVDPTAGNRILTGTGADVSLANNPGCATLIYDSAASRWVVVSVH